LTLIQSREGPDRYGAESRFETIPSRPITLARRNTSSPLASLCSLSTMPREARTSSFASFALRSPSGSGRRPRGFSVEPSPDWLAYASPAGLRLTLDWFRKVPTASNKDDGIVVVFFRFVFRAL
jgi:hypothetical protein